jgi:hypothetical protein
VLHAIALKGCATAVSGDVVALEDAGLVTTTPAGLMLSEDGRRAHDQLLGAERESTDLERLGAAYERFLAVNAPMKALSVRGLSAGEDEQFELIGQAAELIERIEPALRRTVEILPRFGDYGPRLQQALRRAEDGDWSYLTSPRVDSVHTVWMECHEDYLQTLGRSREEEGSY